MTPRRLLITDDESDVRDLLQQELTSAGFIVNTASNGADAVVEAVEGQYDLLIMDMHMVGMDGIEAIRVLHSIRPNLPILGLSGYASRGFNVEARKLNIKLLDKPIDIDDLVKEINLLLPPPAA